MEEPEWLPIKDLLLYRDTIMTYKLKNFKLALKSRLRSSRRLYYIIIQIILYHILLYYIIY